MPRPYQAWFLLAGRVSIELTSPRKLLGVLADFPLRVLYQTTVPILTNARRGCYISIPLLSLAKILGGGRNNRFTNYSQGSYYSSLVILLRPPLSIVVIIATPLRTTYPYEGFFSLTLPLD